MCLLIPTTGDTSKKFYMGAQLHFFAIQKQKMWHWNFKTSSDMVCTQWPLSPSFCTAIKRLTNYSAAIKLVIRKISYTLTCTHCTITVLIGSFACRGWPRWVPKTAENSRCYCSFFSYGFYVFNDCCNAPMSMFVIGALEMHMMTMLRMNALQLCPWQFSHTCYGWGATSENISKIGDFTPTRSLWSKISGTRGRTPAIIFARLVRPINALQLCRWQFSHKETL